jgi:thiosulfate/3-mercaptopyruvate sulfurtransferase
LAALVALGLQGPPAVDSALVSTAWLREHLHDANLVLLHIGTRPGYDSAHIPGAQFIELREIAAPPGPGPLLELPTAARMDSTLAAHGISSESRIVLYWGADWFTPTARVYLTLTWAGLGERTSILDGGMSAWRAAGGPVSAELPVVRRGLPASRPRSDVVVTADYVAAHLRRRGVVIVDARDARFYTGDYPADARNPRPGHVPGAFSIPYTSVVDEQGRVKDAATLRQLFVAAHAEPGDTVVTYCHIGQQASLVWLAARLAGYEARLYDGSFTEWSTLTQYPVEQRP